MNLQRVYDSFIASRLLRQVSLTRYERHHILPRCLGGGNERSNIIRLIPEEHLFAHILLAKIHGGKLAVSAVRMLGMKKYSGRRSRLRYADLRRKHSEATSKRQKGKSIKWPRGVRARAIANFRKTLRENIETERVRLRKQAIEYSNRPETRRARSSCVRNLNLRDKDFHKRKVSAVRRRYKLRRKALSLLKDNSLPKGVVLPKNMRTGGTTAFWKDLVLKLENRR